MSKPRRKALTDPKAQITQLLADEFDLLPETALVEVASGSGLGKFREAQIAQHVGMRFVVKGDQWPAVMAAIRTIAAEVAGDLVDVLAGRVSVAEHEAAECRRCGKPESIPAHGRKAGAFGLTHAFAR